MADQPIPRVTKEPTCAQAIFPLVMLVVLIAASVYLFRLDALNGPMQVALVVCSMVTALIIVRSGHTWEEIDEAGKKGLSSIVSAIFILLAVGALIGAWNLSGTIPTLVYYGIQWISPNWYYFTAAVVCAVVSLSIGSSWTTAGTIGVGLVGIASLVGVSAAITAGAVISGSYLGDKLSPISETTVLASQLAGADVYTHVRAQAWTSVPAFLIALAVYALIGLMGRGVGAPPAPEAAELGQLDQLFWITPLNLIPLLVLAVLSIKKAPPALAIMAAAILAGILGAFLQPASIHRFLAEPGMSMPLASIKALWKSMATGYQANSGIKEIDALLSRGGMESMLKTILLIIAAVNFGALLEEFGLLAKLIDPIIARARTTGRLFLTTAATAVGLNILAADQYIALVLPVRMFRLEFQRRGFAAQTLSRAAADAGTVTSALVPWNSCGAYMAAVLGIPTILYLPFCVFNIMSPILTVLYGFTGFKITRIAPADAGTRRPSAA